MKVKTKKHKPLLIEQTRKVLSYCEIPEKITKTANLDEFQCDSYIEYSICTLAGRSEYSDDFSLDDWLLGFYPELEGQTIFIHIDY